MSLLMDALKKAEQEKKEAARRLKEAQDKTGTHMQLQDDTPNSRPSTASGNASKDTDQYQEQQKQKQVPAPVIEKKSTPELSLTPLDEAASEPAPAPETAAGGSTHGLNESSPPVSHDITIDHPEFSGAGKEPGGDDQAVVLSATDETFAFNDHSSEESMAEPSADPISSTLQEKHADKTLSESRSSKSIVSAAQLVKDMGGGKEAPTPVAAQTVFRASARNSGRQQMVEWVMFLGLLTVVLVAAGTFYYFRITPLVPDTASPLVARGIEAELTPPMVMPVPAAAPATGGLIEESPSDRGTAEDPAVAGNDEATSGTAAIAITGETEISMPTGEEIMEPAMDAAVARAETPAEIPAEETVLPEKIEVDTAAIAISRSKSVDQHDQLINKAYTDYVAGNFVRAESVYHEVLREKPENRDALLGIAAIAWRKGDLQLAYENYLKVLQLFPRDITARTALVNLQGNAVPVQSESMVKIMLQEDPDADFLYFTLGNIYAAQSRWEEAQQAFFEAWRRQSDNSDYAYNLAVSLDHIGQAKTARKYYRMALDLADKAPQNGFNTAAVMARLNTLSSLPEND